MAKNKEDTKQCVECGRRIPASQESDYCKKCDDALDKRFNEIESNIVVFKELMDHEIEVLNKFDQEDIIELYKDVYDKLSEDGPIDEREALVLKKIQTSFDLQEKDIGKDRVVDVQSAVKIEKKRPERCLSCDGKLKEEYNYCPYCGIKIE